MAGVRIRFGGRSRGGHRPLNRGGVGGRIVQSLFFLVFGLIGTAVFAALAFDISQRWNERGWTATPCTIEHSQAVHDTQDRKHRFEVRYRYTHGGQDHVSTQYQVDYEGDDDATTPQRLVQRYPAGSSQTCYVNPSDPSQAILQTRGMGMVFVLLLPLVFMAVGFGGLFFTWKPRRTASAGSDATAASEAISETIRGKVRNKALLAGFFAIFGLAGIGFLIPFFILPALSIIDARQWQPTPCTILSSQVKSHRGSDSTTYSVDIHYEYEVGGVRYTSNRYHFMGGSSSGRSGKARIVQQYPRGSQQTCYVNPRDPLQAVLNPGWTNDLWFGLIPLLFVMVGVGGVGGTLVSMVRDRRRQRDPLAITASARQRETDRERGGDRSRRAERRATSASVRGAGPDQYDWLPALNRDRPAVFTSSKGKILGVAVFLLVFGLFWNGMVWFLLVPSVIDGWRGASGFGVIFALFFTLFATPFVLVGAGVFVGVLYMILQSFNPKLRLTLDRAVVEPGGTIEARWELLGRTDRIRKLTVSLEAVESATYRRGTRTTTDTHTFRDITVTEIDTARQLQLDGGGTIAIPGNAMHSFKSANNAIQWQVRVRGEISFWPDVNETFTIAVVPAGWMDRR